ncbi:MAG: hypothetical protein BJ554DRAFT_2836 [Olpidium bornovanus]|uniref:Uncharacterized protein n=1 Tax=Olpidium bornovanus TaxID=278681 RepID=A0A8H8DGD0_9FUNG|nr:MAG: hypothetical protein BJ554DRAFT_2836 [Olpidium bornovanus]
MMTGAERRFQVRPPWHVALTNFRHANRMLNSMLEDVLTSAHRRCTDPAQLDVNRRLVLAGNGERMRNLGKVSGLWRVAGAVDAATSNGKISAGGETRKKPVGAAPKQRQGV